jgi:NADPH2:quinone reductase
VRAIVCEAWGGPERLVLRNLPEPQPAPGEVVVRVLAAGVNFPDVLIIHKKYQLQPELPFIPGAELCGEVLRVGAGVEHLRVGDRIASVCQVGAFAEQAGISAALCMKIPPALDAKVAAALLLAHGTSWHAVRDRAALQAGETMLVLGAAGGVGLAAVQIGKLLGARIVAATSSDAKLAICKQHGADEVINYATEDLRAGIKRTCGKGPDVIYDPIGGPYSEPAFRSIGWRGRHLVVGFAAGDIPAMPMNLLLLKGASLVGVFWGDYVRREPARWTEDFNEMMVHIASRRLLPLISRTYPLDQTQQALIDMSERKVMGKIVIVP